MDQSICYFKKAAAGKSFRITPFQYRPITFFDDLHGNAMHIRCGSKFIPEHIANSRPAFYRLFRHLVIDCIFVI